jgi:hypothetical protein
LLAPGSHFLSIPYTEGLFAALLAAALLAIARNELWLTAGFGALASATRSAGVVVFVCLACEAWKLRRESRAAIRASLAAVSSLAGLIGFAWFCYRTSGDPIAFVHNQSRMGRNFSLVGPLQAVFRFDVDPDYYLFTAAVVIALVAMWRTVRGVELVAAVFLVALPLFTGSLKAMIRYQTVNVGLAVGVAAALPRAMRATLIGCAVLLVLETVLFGKGIGHF